jgi:tetratricopeptide (TPR) repeat protein
LLRWEEPGRFTMLETLRECAGERLRERPERERIREQHAAWVAALIGEEEPPQAQRLAWYRTLDAEVDNLRAALEWTRESGHSEEGMRMLLTTSRYWVMRGWVTERHQRLLAMLALPGESDRHMRARALALAGGTAGDSGRAMLEEGLALSRQLSDAGLEVECLFALAYLATADRDLDRAEELVRTSLRLAQKLGDTFRVALGFDHLGLIAARRGDLLRAVTMEEQSLRLMLEIGDAHQATRLLSNLANYAFRCGDLRRARASLLDALSHADPAGYEGAPAYIVETAAGVAVAGGATELGAKLLGAALTARIKIAWEPDEEERIAVEMAAELGAAAIGTVAWEQAVETGRSLTPRACAALIREMCQDECEAWAEPAGERPAGVDWERA